MYRLQFYRVIQCDIELYIPLYIYQVASESMIVWFEEKTKRFGSLGKLVHHVNTFEKSEWLRLRVLAYES